MIKQRISMKRNVILLFACLFSLVINAQVEVVEYDNNEWARKENREEIARIYYGEVDEAISNMQEKKEEPGLKHDPELLYSLSLA